MILAALGKDLLQPIHGPLEPVLLRVGAVPLPPPDRQVDDALNHKSRVAGGCDIFRGSVRQFRSSRIRL